jgi:hypothetical protein
MMCLSSCFGSGHHVFVDIIYVLTLVRKDTAADKKPRNAEGRAQKRKADGDRIPNGSRKRSRSMSSSSSNSVSTISTNLSRSPSPSFEPAGKSRDMTTSRNVELGKRRRRSRSSSLSYTSEASSVRLRNGHIRDNSRNTRRRRCSISPGGRGRERYHHQNMMDDRPDGEGITRRISRSVSSSLSNTSASSFHQRHRRRSAHRDRNARNRRSSVSLDSRGRERELHGKISHRRTRSRSESRDRSEVARNRRSMTPGTLLRSKQKYLDSPADNDRYGSSFRGLDRDNSRAAKFASSPRLPRKERSLSPFSKRLALTQAMNMGR